MYKIAEVEFKGVHLEVAFNFEPAEDGDRETPKSEHEITEICLGPDKT